MAGTKNDVLVGKNADFTQVNAPNATTSESNGLVTNGQLWIGSTATNAGGTHINVGNLTSPGTTLNIGYSSPNITLDVDLSIFSIVRQVFTGNGTYTPTSGMRYADIEVVGGGGGGGGAAATAAGTLSAAAGGSAGGYARKVFNSATIGLSQTVTVGAAGSGGTAGNNSGGNGGTTSVGSLISATGGNGGGGSGASANQVQSSSVAAVGVGSNGDFNISGNIGWPGYLWPSGVGAIVIGGRGGNSFYGQGAGQTSGTAGGAASGYGAGGAGGSNGVSSAAVAGGAGTAGIVIITEYVLI